MTVKAQIATFPRPKHHAMRAEFKRPGVKVCSAMLYSKLYHVLPSRFSLGRNFEPDISAGTKKGQPRRGLPFKSNLLPVR